MSTALQPAAPLLELFASLQGEGAYVGEPQLFLRLAGCPLRCRWCDTPESWPLEPRDGARIDAPAGSRRAPAWTTATGALRLLDELDPGGARTVSVTGGEPLMWPAFLEALHDALGGRRRLHLETAAAHPAVLARLAVRFDHLSLDLKLPDDMEPPRPLEPPADRALEPFEVTPETSAEWARTRRAVLALAAGRDACGKLVVAGGRRPERFQPLFADVARWAPALPLFLQPATPVRGVEAPAPALLDELARRARELGLRVRVLPQVHRLLGLP